MHQFKRVLTMASPVLLLWVGIGCAPPGQDGGTRMPPPNSSGDYSTDWPDLGRGPDRYITFELGDSFETCRHLSPKFPFDSAHTRAQDRVQLRAFADCMNDPVMAKRKLLLIGRTDERGTPAYNDALGMKRAQRIKALLVDNGISADRIEMKTAGATDAQGGDGVSSYGYDRRVDVVVEGGAQVPGVPKAS